MMKMCETCLHINQQSKISSYDPTRTTVLRNSMARESNRRFDKFTSLIGQAISERNVFGLEVLQSLPPEKAFAHLSDAGKIDAFMKWIDELVASEIVEFEDYIYTYDTRLWLNNYIKTAYEKGVERARQELRKAGLDVPTLIQAGGLATVMSVPVHVDTLAMMYIRTFNELKGVTDVLKQQISRILAEGLLTGANPRVLARRIMAVVNGKNAGELGLYDSLGRFIPAKRRAELIARTEIIRAHHQANIMEYKNWGLTNVIIKAEFSSAGDNRVCEHCASLDGQIFTLDEILPMIPVHPLCRCIAIPVFIPVNYNLN